MEKHFITTLLVLVLLAPQSGLEAKSRHHGVKERDHDAEERDHEDKKRYHKAKKRHHKSKKHHHKSKKHHHKSKKHHHKSKKHHHSSPKFFRFARATKAELELLNQAISNVNARIDALGQPATGVPAGLETTLRDLRADVELNKINIGINKSGVDFNTPQITQNDIAIGEIRADILELSKLIEELHPQPPAGASFSGNFIGGEAPVEDGGGIAAAWAEFTGNAIGTFGTFSSIEIRSVSDGGATIDSAICNDPIIADQIATALSSSTTIGPLDCGAGRTWSVNDCGLTLGVELRAGTGAGATECTCSPGAIVIRPLSANEFWGGAGLAAGTTSPCREPSQTLEVDLTPNL